MAQTNHFKAIETSYAGCRFRSRTEARYAVFFDTLGISWEYEKEGYLLEGTPYLPDFWLPEQDCFIEIKGQMPTDEELIKARLLSLYTQKEVCVLYGPVEVPPDYMLNSHLFLPPTLWKFHEDERVVCGPSTTQIAMPSHILAILQGLWDHNLQFSIRSDGEIEIIPCLNVYPADSVETLIEDLENHLAGLRQFKDRIEEHIDEIKSLLSLEEGWTFDFLSQSDFDEACTWYECKRCKSFVLGSTVKKHHKCHDGVQSDLEQLTPRIQAAYTAARSARFEFGEKGR